jgi:ribosomal protein S18 acetylase RimI-like enzyme
LTEIRPFAPADIPAVLDLWRESEGLGVGPGDTVEGVTRHLERNPGCSWVAADGGRIAGAILCGHDGRRGHLYHLAIAPAYRRQGLASALVEKSLAALRGAGIERCLLSVLTDNAGATEFWTSIGARMRPELQLLSFDIR